MHSNIYNILILVCFLTYCFSIRAEDKIHPMIKVDMIALQFYWRGEMHKALNRLDYSLEKKSKSTSSLECKRCNKFL